MRHTLEQIQYIYNELKNENEIAIIENYGYEGKRYTIVFTRKISDDDFHRLRNKLKYVAIKIKCLISSLFRICIIWYKT